VTIAIVRFVLKHIGDEGHSIRISTAYRGERSGAQEYAVSHIETSDNSILDPDRRAGGVELLGRERLDEQGTDIRWHRVEPTAVDDPYPGVDRLVVVPVDDLPDPVYLPGQVTVVGPGVDTRLDQRSAVLRIRADGRADDARARGDFPRAKRAGSRVESQ